MTDSCQTFDVAVIGGGSAGLAAAITAAREGARTLLIERYGYLGGMGTASLVHTFCGLYLLREEPGAVLANPGFATEMARRMTEATGMQPVRLGRVDVLLQHPVDFVRIADEMVAAEPLLSCQLHTEVLAVQEMPTGWRIEVSTRSRRRSYMAKALVDASGDAVVADFLGMEATVSPILQRPAYVFGIHRLGCVDDAARLAVAGLIVQGVREGALHPHALGISFRSSGREGELFANLDLSGGVDYDPLAASCLTELETGARHLAAAIVRWLQRTADGWQAAYISQWPIRAGVRESRRWVGEYTLTGQDIFTGARFTDEIGLATWPMEFRENTRGPKLRYPQHNLPAGIPLRCLIPTGAQRLFVAGRCISADHDAQASIRVMGTCFVTGEAAGRAAARCSAE